MSATFTDSKGRIIPVEITMNAPDKRRAINICALFDSLWPEGWYRLGYDVTTPALSCWLAENKACYYAAPRETFSRRSAIDAAASCVSGIVVMEDMS